jgi:hypothetical protein
MHLNTAKFIMAEMQLINRSVVTGVEAAPLDSEYCRGRTELDCTGSETLGIKGSNNQYLSKSKHPNRSLETQDRSHLTRQPGKLFSIELYGLLPTWRRHRYILVCSEVFSTYVKLYPPQTAATWSCLNKLTNRYFVEAVKPNVIFSDNGTSFHSQLWKGTMQKHEV